MIGRLATAASSAAFLSIAYLAIWSSNSPAPWAASPLRIKMFLVGSLTALLAMILAASPRLIRINICVFFGFVAIVELALLVLPDGAPNITSTIICSDGSSFILPDSQLGTSLAKNASATHSKYINAKLAYSVEYATDSVGRRVTPSPLHTGTSSAALFLGGSNTFGEGLSATDTLPYHVSSLVEGLRAYNYGVPGYGPGQALLQCETRLNPSDMNEPVRYGVFTFIADHVPRTIGRSNISASWGKQFPCYEHNSSGALVYRGSFVDAHPVRTSFYQLLHMSNMIRWSRFALPPHFTLDALELTSDVLAATRDEFKRAFPAAEYYVLLAPTTSPAGSTLLQRVKTLLDVRDIEIIDASTEVDMQHPASTIHPHDLHHSGQTNRVLAHALASAFERSDTD